MAGLARRPGARGTAGAPLKIAEGRVLVAAYAAGQWTVAVEWTLFAPQNGLVSMEIQFCNRS